MAIKVWLRMVAVLVTLALFAPAPVVATDVNEAQIDAAIESGVAWLIGQQSANGGWPGYYEPGRTGMSVAVLGHHAERLGMLPLDAGYPYRENMLKGLNHIFSVAYHDAANERVWFGSSNFSSGSNYAAGPALMAIVLSGDPNRVVDVDGSNVIGLTYREVARRIVNTLSFAQITSGTGIGSWDYSHSGTTGDLSVGGWVTLGLGYARDRFNITIPADVIGRIDESIDVMQQATDEAAWSYGGAGYASWDWMYWVNSHKVGHLLYMMYTVGDAANAPRVMRSLGFLDRYWEHPSSGRSGGQNDAGWRGNPPTLLPSYIGTATITKGLVALAIEELGEIDWFTDISNVVVNNQHADGYWDQGGYPDGESYRNVSTAWALLTLLRAAPLDPLLDNWRNLTTTSGDFLATSGMGGTGYYIVVARGATPPTEEQIEAGVDYADVTVVTSGSGTIEPDVERFYPVTGLQPGTTYDLWFVVKDDEDTYSRILRSPFATLSGLMSPSGGIIVTDRLSPFVWPVVDGATWYRIWINRNGQPFFVRWFQGQPPTNFPLHGLPGGEYRWWVQPWAPVVGRGPWEGPADFSVVTRAPGEVTLIAPVGPQGIGPSGFEPAVVVADPDALTYRWTKDIDATWYRLWVGWSGTDAWHTQWYQLDGTGEAAVSVPSHPGGEFHWWVRPWGPDGSGPWSGSASFTSPNPLPGKPQLTSPSGVIAAGRPRFMWADTHNATWYRITVMRGNTRVVNEWTQATNLRSPVDLGPGDYVWWVAGWNAETGELVWSLPMGINVR